MKTKLLALGLNSGQAQKGYAAKILIKDHVDIGPDSSFHKSFHRLKKELSEKPIVYHFCSDHELYVFVDASKEMGIRAVAYQMSSSGEEY